MLLACRAIANDCVLCPLSIRHLSSRKMSMYTFASALSSERLAIARVEIRNRMKAKNSKKFSCPQGCGCKRCGNNANMKMKV